MYLHDFIEERLNGFTHICKFHKVNKLYIFGSSITDGFNQQQSDIDALVEIDATEPIERGEMLLSLWDELELFFGRRVDLLTEGAVKNPYLKAALDRTKKLIYDGEGEKILI